MTNNDRNAMLWSRENQYEISYAKIFNLGTDGSDSTNQLDIKSMIEEFDFYEDIFESSTSAQILIADPFNLPDLFPITGGERISMAFKTTSFKDDLKLRMVVYKVGERIKANDSTKAQMYWLYLITEDAWNDAQLDVSFGTQGTYTDIITKSLDMIGSKKKRDLDQSLGITGFVSPYWSPMTCVKFSADRAMTADGDPMFFWETSEGYSLKPLKKLYAQAPVKQVFIDPRNTIDSLDDAKVFNQVLDWNYDKSDDKLRQNKEGSFGTDCYYLNSDWNISRRETTLTEIQSVSIEKNPIVDAKSSKRNKTTFRIALPDGSDQKDVMRRAMLDRIDNKRMVIEIPGDSSVHAGQTIDLDVPSLTSGIDYAKERTSSGKWLIASARHILRRDRYRMNLELIKDSTETKLK